MSQAERRSTDRKKRRIPCQLFAGEREHAAMILDLSPSGLFIQTHAKTQRAERLRIRFPHGDAMLDLEVEVVRALKMPQHLVAAAKGGIGVRIVRAPDAYYELLSELRITEHPKTIQLRREPERRFRVHVRQIGGPRSRRLELVAPDDETAATRALGELGDGWKVLRVESV